MQLTPPCSCGMTLVRLGVLLLLCIGPEVHPAPGPQVWVPPFPSAGGYPAAAPPFQAPAVPVAPLEYVPAPEVQGPGMLEGMIEAGKVSKYNIISLLDAKHLYKSPCQSFS